MTELKTPVRLLTHSKTVDRRDLNVTDSRSSVRPFAKRAAAYVRVSFRALHRSGFSELIGDSSAGLERIRRGKWPAVPDAPKATASLKYARLQTRTGGVGLTVEQPAILPRAHKRCAEKSGRRSRQRRAVLTHFAFKAKARVF